MNWEERFEQIREVERERCCIIIDEIGDYATVAAYINAINKKKNETKEKSPVEKVL